MGRASIRVKWATGLVILCLSLCGFFYVKWFWPVYDPKFRDYDQLASAIGRNDLARVEDLLKAGVDPNWFPHREIDNMMEADMTPLLLSNSDDKIQITRLLLKCGANPELGTGWGDPLTFAVQMSQPKTFDLLANNVKNWSESGPYYLWFAATQGDATMTEVLLKNGVSANSAYQGNSVLAVVQENGGKPEVERILVKYGATGKSDPSVLKPQNTKPAKIE